MRPNFISRYLLFLAIALSTALSKQAVGEEIFSKSDAEEIFGTTLNEWNQRVVQLHQSGAGVAGGDISTGLSVSAKTNAGFLIIAPYYVKDEKPEFIIVTIGYPDTLNGMLTIPELTKTMDEAADQLLPEYILEFHIEHIEQGVAIFSTINES